MKTEKDDEKKSVFEPVSAEEAKQMRAYANDDISRSGDEDCGSGWTDAYAACLGKGEGQFCCMRNHTGDVHGICAYNKSGAEAFQLKCITNPTELPDVPCPEDTDCNERNN